MPWRHPALLPRQRVALLQSLEVSHLLSNTWPYTREYKHSFLAGVLKTIKKFKIPTSNILCAVCLLEPLQQADVSLTIPGHTVNISASALQHPLKQTQDIMKVTHYPTPPSMPAAAAAAAAMHAGAQHQHIAQIHQRAGNHLDASSPLTVSPNSSRSTSPVGMHHAQLAMHLPGVCFGKTAAVRMLADSQACCILLRHADMLQAVWHL